MKTTAEEIVEKLDRLIDWYGKGSHGSSERFNDGRLSGLWEIRDFIRRKEEEQVETREGHE